MQITNYLSITLSHYQLQNTKGKCFLYMDGLTTLVLLYKFGNLISKYPKKTF